jgi:hypothetical protein
MTLLISSAVKSRESREDRAAMPIPVALRPKKCRRVSMMLCSAMGSSMDLIVTP